MDITLIGVPFNGDGTPVEVENPAAALRQAGLISILEKAGHGVIDSGDLTLPVTDGQRDKESGILNLTAWRQVSNLLANTINNQMEKGRFLLVLGGDCGILVGIAAAYNQAQIPLGLIFLDGHADFQMPQTSPEGELADMELAVLTGYAPQPLVAPLAESPLIAPENVAVFGIRAHEGIDRTSIEVFDHSRMAENGIQPSVAEGLQPLLVKNLPLWLHFDVDVIDPEWMPVNFPEPGGLSIEEVKQFIQLTLATRRVVGMSVTCFHPDLDVTDRSTARLAALIAGGLQKTHRIRKEVKN